MDPEIHGSFFLSIRFPLGWLIINIPFLAPPKLPAVVFWPGHFLNWHMDAEHGTAGAGLPPDWFRSSAGHH
jgi:hypothetical protein